MLKENQNVLDLSNFEHADDAAKDVGALNGKKFDDKKWHVGKAEKKNKELKNSFKNGVMEEDNMYALNQHEDATMTTSTPLDV
ncbi:hypothetical protein C2S52_019823 [Perilla frutescens var. hirtella]|nr:hypothetical protein C2S52_019823 [Perilla frutescens var. hirtella]KAH6805942.1 hypothetical protein C2S51_030773 [Perilla frutescens var. frutescens]